MSQLKLIDVYSFDELDERAKDRAREWFRDGALDDDWYDFIYEDAERIAEIIGVTFDQKQVPLMNGSSRSEPKIWFSVSWSQGDGASFEGSYRYAKGASKNIRSYAPNDKTLHQIADDLTVIQKENFYQLYANVSQGGHYCHSFTMRVSVDRDSSNWQAPTEGAEDGIEQAMRDFADWIYRQLVSQAEYLLSDENVDESIRINKYKFCENGEPDF